MKILKKIVLFFLFLPVFLSAQVIENDWINYSQNYFKFPIYSNGVYKITYSELIKYGVNVNAINPKSIQIFYKGQEQYIHVEGENDEVFNVNDFLEFYGEKNDGSYDGKLLKDSSNIGNPFYSMFTDTSFYFLTWNNSTNNKRLSIETEGDYTSYTPAEYFWSEVVASTAEIFQGGEMTMFKYAAPEFSDGVGYGTNDIKFNITRRLDLSTPNPYKLGPDPKIISGISGRTSGTHNVWARINGKSFFVRTFYDYDLFKINETFDKSWLDNAIKVQYTSMETSSSVNDRIAAMNLKIKYPRTFDLSGSDKFEVIVNSGSQSKDLLQFSNFNNRNTSVWLYDFTNKKRIVVQVKNSLFSALVDNNGQERKCFLTCEAAMKSVDNIFPVSGTSSFFINYKELSTIKGGANYFIVSAKSLLLESEEYAVYRTNGIHNAIVFDIEQLYDQYAYGIRKHPLAIRNLMIEAYNEWLIKPKNLLLIGKSVNIKDSRSGALFKLNSVPTWGPLGADVGFTNLVFGASVLEPLIPTGRISAITGAHVSSYLEKVKAYEIAEHSEWMKNILHFGGGEDASQQRQFKEYLASYEAVAEAPKYGGNVHTFLKESSDPLQVNESDSVRNLVNNGVTLMTFFGHASAQSFDQGIEEPSSYENTGKYGFILANGCLIGNIHTPNDNSGSERFVLADSKGTIGFLASASLGVPKYLNQYSLNFYKNLFDLDYQKSIGEVINQTILAIQDSSNSLSRDVCMHMTLHGDPALVLNSQTKPDYTLYGEQGNTQPRVFFNPAIVTNEVDSFTVNIIVANIGKAQLDTFDVLIKRKFPDNHEVTYVFTLNNVFYKDTLTFKVPVDLATGVGLNVFSVEIDTYDKIDELTNDNNNGSVNLFIKSSEIVPIYPYEYAVVPNALTKLKASTGEVYASSQLYVFQIDTTDKFNSVSRVQDTINGYGGVIEWDPNKFPKLKSFYSSFPSTNDLSKPNVYFWRVAPVLSSGDTLWKSSSFQYVTGKTGWGQSHFHQFKKNNFEFLDYEYNLKTLNFKEQTKTLSASVHANVREPYRAETGYKIDGASVCQSYYGYDEFPNMIFLAVVDQITLKPWHRNDHGDRGHANYNYKLVKGWNEYNYYYYENDASIDSITSFLKSIPDSNYVLLYHIGAHNLNNFYKKTSGAGLRLKNQMQLMGADTDSMANFSSSYPYVFFAKKGNPNVTKELFSTGQEFITLTGIMQNSWLDGTMSSVNIGPAKAWHSFHWEMNAGETGNILDTNKIRLYKIDPYGEETLVIDTLLKQGDVLNLSSINAQDFPNLKLDVYLKDDLNRTPNVLKRWQVLFDEIPDAALNPSRLLAYELQDTLQQGEDFTFATIIENVTNVDMDSIQVAYWLVDDQYNLQNKTYKMLKPLKGGEFVSDTIVVPSGSLKNLNSFWYEVNPYDGLKPWQIEKHHFNNIYKSQFQVNLDKINPILDVTFDGVHILDGDIVSPYPMILLTLDDENQYFALDDKSDIQLYIYYPNDSLVLIKQADYVFNAASLPKNKASIEFKGSFPVDGKYELRIIATDRAKNISGKGDGSYNYKMAFEVITESSITQLINWPNPFSTSTQFVFVLTGSEIPSDFLIQITTITGKVVREINKDEIGPIHIGRNITEFKWEGTDSYGDKLANGVYFYRVIVQNNGMRVKERTVNISDNEGSSTLSNKYFQKGFGKMYILR